MDQLSAKAAAPASLHRRHTVPRAETNNTFNPSSVVEKKRPLSIMASSHGIAAVYIVSGCLQPILLTVCKDSGLGDPLAQVYMFFYSLGPALVVIPLITTNKQLWPSWSTIFRAMGIAVFDVLATCTNYYGASLAGPTIFAIVYSSVTVWTAVYSHFVLKRIMNRSQWLAVLTVFGGLALTATDSLELGHSVMMGLVIVIFGSAMHALTYIASEIIMNIGSDSLTASQNCAVQAGIGALVFLCWQLIYTIPNFQEALAIPMQQAGTSVVLALFILSSFGLANLVHSLAFYSTLLNFPGGATSAGTLTFKILMNDKDFPLKLS
jgi:drug/metabolite transporter (DMT)-like permease